MKYLWLCFIYLFTNTAIRAQSGQCVYVLGIAQDGGYPHIGCYKQCCKDKWGSDSLKTYIVSLALVDYDNRKWYLFEATPDIKYQLHLLKKLTNGAFGYLPDGIFLTHAHIGHYTGLMELGREALNSKSVKVYCLPDMAKFLKTNGPWSQLVNLDNIELNIMTEGKSISLGSIEVNAMKVPHRDEFSETAGFFIKTISKKYLFIPDINKWQIWNKNIIEEVRNSDYAFIDATFYDETELPGVRMASVPHPFVTETKELFQNETKLTKSKIHFIHFNHTNPLLTNKDLQNNLKLEGYNIAIQGKKYE